MTHSVRRTPLLPGREAASPASRPGSLDLARLEALAAELDALVGYRRWITGSAFDCPEVQAALTESENALWDSVSHAATEYEATPRGICPVCMTEQPMSRERIAAHPAGIGASQPPCPGRDQLPRSVWRGNRDGAR